MFPSSLRSPALASIFALSRPRVMNIPAIAMVRVAVCTMPAMRFQSGLDSPIPMLQNDSQIIPADSPVSVEIRVAGQTAHYHDEAPDLEGRSKDPKKDQSFARVPTKATTAMIVAITTHLTFSMDPMKKSPHQAE